MARGWESKSVGDQIDAAKARHGEQTRVRLTAEQIEIERRCDSLMLQRTRITQQLANCTDERYRKTLAEGLAFLEDRLRELGWTPPKSMAATEEKS